MLIDRFKGRSEEREPVAPLLFQVGAAQWQGTREAQNDVILTTQYDAERGILLAVADGIGVGEEAGAAAETAVVAMRREYEAGAVIQEMPQQLLRLIGGAHAAVRRGNEQRMEQGEMPAGAALAGVLVRGSLAAVASVGNVRVFLLRSGLLLQLNRDHLLSLEAEERDILAGEAPETEPEWAMTVTAYAGMEGLTALDYLQTPLRLVSSDRLVLISSGLYGVVPEGEFTEILSEADPQIAAERLIARVQAMNQPSQSNVSVAILKISRRRRAADAAYGR